MHFYVENVYVEKLLELFSDFSQAVLFLLYDYSYHFS